MIHERGLRIVSAFAGMEDGQPDHFVAFVADYYILVGQLAVGGVAGLFEIYVKRVGLVVIRDSHIALRSLFDHRHKLQIVLYFS